MFLCSWPRCTEKSETSKGVAKSLTYYCEEAFAIHNESCPNILHQRARTLRVISNLNCLLILDPELLIAICSLRSIRGAMSVKILLKSSLQIRNCRQTSLRPKNEQILRHMLYSHADLQFAREEECRRQKMLSWSWISTA